MTKLTIIQIFKSIDARNLQKLFSLSVLILLILSSALALNTDPVLAQESANPNSFNPQAILRESLQWIDSLGALGAIAFIALYIIASVAFFPGSILTLGAGLSFPALKRRGFLKSP
ncbi:hypothetical protein [Nostoc mirabile]|uniref:hypothetical protein n=1 Tax=Nostoc mirabile TaxID=2907820 RepID=UPI0035563C63